MKMVQTDSSTKEVIFGMDHKNDLLKCHIHPPTQEFLNRILNNDLMQKALGQLEEHSYWPL